MRTILKLSLLILIGLTTGCSTPVPKRDQIPLLKDRLFRLQVAVESRNRAAIDSLLAPQILDRGQSSDSLLGFVYGPDGNYPFRQFGDANIVYTSDKARIDCRIMDTSGTGGLSITFFMAHQNDLWLITSFERGSEQIEGDSLKATE